MKKFLLVWVASLMVNIARGTATPMPEKEAHRKGQSYLQDALQEAKTSPLGSQTDSLLRQIALAQAHLGDRPAALRTADTGMGNNDKDKVYAEIATMQAQGGDINGALRTAGSIKNAYDRDRTTAAIVKAQCKVDGIAATERTVQDLQGDGAKAEALREIANAQAQSRDTDAAVHTVAEIRKLENWPDNTTWLAVSDIAKTEALAGDVSAGLRRARDIPDFFRKEAALEASGVALANAGNVSAALRFAEAIRNVNAIRGMAGDREDAAFYAAQRRQRNDSEVNVLCAIAVAEIKAGKADDALTLAARIMRIHKDGSDVPDIVQALAQTGNVPAARLLANSIVSRMCKDLAVRSIAKAQATAGDLAGALQTVKEIQNPEWRSGTIDDVVQTQAQSGDITGALRLAESMNKDIHQASAIGHIAARQVLAGNDVEAERTLLLLAQGLPRIEGDLTVAQVLISLCK